MIVSKSLLAHVLIALGKLVCRTSPVEVYRCVRLQGAKNKLTLSVVSPKESLQVDLPADGEDVFDAVILFASLKDAVKGGGEGTVTFSMTDGILNACVTGAHKTASIPFPLRKEEWPNGFQVPADAKSVTLPDGFCSMLATAAPLVDRANYRRLLQGIHLCEEVIVATNGKELLHIPLALEGVAMTIPFPLAMLAAKETQGGTLQFWQSDTLDFTMTLGPWRWSAETLPGTYPSR